MGAARDALDAATVAPLGFEVWGGIVSDGVDQGGVRVQYTSGFWYASALAGNTGNAQQAVGELRLFRQDFFPGTMIDGLGMNVPATPGTGGATYTICIYNDTGSNYPGTLQKATSALDVTSTGIKSETFTAEDVSGVRWLGTLCLVNGAAVPSGITSGMPGIGASTITNANNVWTGYNQTGLGSAPGTFTTTRNPINGITRVFFRIG